MNASREGLCACICNEARGSPIVQTLPDWVRKVRQLVADACYVYWGVARRSVWERLRRAGVCYCMQMNWLYLHTTEGWGNTLGRFGSVCNLGVAFRMLEWWRKCRQGGHVGAILVFSIGFFDGVKLLHCGFQQYLKAILINYCRENCIIQNINSTIEKLLCNFVFIQNNLTSFLININYTLVNLI